MTNAKSPSLSVNSAVFLQALIVLFGVGALTFMLWEPHLEGRNANATVFAVYFKDPFLAFAYIASIPFFVALYQALKLLGYAGHNRLFSPAAVRAMKMIKFCALAVLGFVILSVAFMPMADPDDRPPGVVMRLVLAFGAIVVAVVAAMFERILQNALEIKCENDLTV